MKLNIKDFDWKQFFIEKGERVGLAITALLMAVMTVVSLFMPNHGFLVPSPGNNAELLTKTSDEVVQKQNSARPAAADKPGPIPAVPVSFESGRIDNAGEFQIASRFLPPPAGSTKRRMPGLFQPDQGVATVALSQIRAYVFSPDGENRYGYIMTIEKDGGPTAASANATAAPTSGRQRGNAPPSSFVSSLQTPGAFGAGGGPIGRPSLGQTGTPGLGALGGFGGGQQRGQPVNAMAQQQMSRLRPGQMNNGMPGGSAPKKTPLVKVSDITEENLPHFAERVLPLRQAIICATFPYRRQVEEFMHKLHLQSTADVLAEGSEELDEDGSDLPAFRFLGVDVQRREIGTDGKPANNWQTLDLKAALKPYIIENGTRFEDDPKEPPGIDALLIDGLWMPLLKQFDTDGVYSAYPKPEMELPNLLKTLQELKGKDIEKIIHHDNPITDKDKFNPFRRQSQGGARQPVTRATQPGPGGNPLGSFGAVGGQKPQRVRGGARGRLGGAPGAGGEPAVAADAILPDHVLVRVVDVTIEAGRVYEYRLHVRMANPNYKRNAEVLSPSYAVETELYPEKERKDSDWFVVPGKVSVPPEFYYYAVDQKELEPGRAYQGIHVRDTVDRDRQTVFQIHRWLEDASRNVGQPMWVGEWAVAERVLVSRGEYIGRTEKVDVPLWRPGYERFELAVPPSGATRRHPTGIDVDFSLPNDDAVLVDFEGGPLQYQRKIRRDDRTETVKIDDKSSTEVLLVSSDGRVTARSSVLDTLNADRKDQLDKWRNRIQNVRSGGQGGPGGGNPFGPNPRPTAPGGSPGGKPPTRGGVG